MTDSPLFELNVPKMTTTRMKTVILGSMTATMTKIVTILKADDVDNFGDEPFQREAFVRSGN